jgi:hypothetical protein
MPSCTPCVGHASHRLLLLLRVLQSPNSPLEVSVTADLWPLLKFATAANTFLPITPATGTGGLVMLPAVLPAAPAEPAPVAVDYRFDDAKQQLVPYAIRLQRFTASLPEGELLAQAKNKNKDRSCVALQR